jgi:uncharacterized phage protein (TIGR01671 family)
MKREIKFRAWDGESTTMRKVEELSFDEDGFMHGLLQEDEGVKKTGGGIGRVYLGERVHVDVGNPNSPEGWVDDYPLMQYTGLKDKNGKEIYEGDIVGIHYPANAHSKQTGIHRNGAVNYRAGVFYIGYNGLLDALGVYATSGSQEIEIIGDIYTTPELLEG